MHAFVANIIEHDHIIITAAKLGPFSLDALKACINPL